MNDYLKKAFDSLSISEIENLIYFILDKKRIVYESISSDIDNSNELIILNDLENKLEVILVNLVQQERRKNNS